MYHIRKAGESEIISMHRDIESAAEEAQLRSDHAKCAFEIVDEETNMCWRISSGAALDTRTHKPRHWTVESVSSFFLSALFAATILWMFIGRR